MNLQDYLTSALREGFETGCFPSAAAAVGDREGLLAQAFIGEAPLPGDRPVDENTLYDMASLSKVLGPTMIALKGLEAGDVCLTDRIGDFFPDAPADKRDITVEMLMTHTGGFNPSFRLDKIITDPKDTLACILDRPLEGPPGEIPRYSCMGYITFAKMLEKRYGAPLDVLARERVFLPLGMDDTGYCPRDKARCAATEIDPETGRPIIGVVHDENARFQGGVSGNAGVFMPLKDGIRFALMLSRMGEGYLKRSTLEEAVRNHTPGQEAHRGLGFQIAGTPDCFFSDKVPENCFGHTGFTGTSLMIEPGTGLWVLLLTNRVYPTRENLRLMPFRRRIHGDLWQMYRGI